MLADIVVAPAQKHQATTIELCQLPSAELLRTFADRTLKCGIVGVLPNDGCIPPG